MIESWKRFGDWVARCEQWPFRPAAVAATLAAVIALRNVLEIMLARNPTFAATAAFVHYPLAYVGPFLALTLTLAYWAKLPPARVARLMIAAWTLTLLPPLADILLHRTHEVPTIGYFIGDPSDLGWVFAHFFDPRTTLGGTTLGIRLETGCAVLLAGLYVVLRSGRVWRGLAAALSVYVVSLFFFTLPLVVLSVMRSFEPSLENGQFLRGTGIVWRGELTTFPDSLAILWLVPVLAVGLFLWQRLERAHPEECWFPPLTAESPLPRGLVAVPWAGYLLGLMAAWFLFLPEGTTIAMSSFDRLALPGAALALWFGVRTAVARGGRQLIFGAGWLALSIALDRAFGVPAAASVLVLAPWGAGLFGPRLRTVASIASGAVSSLCACAAGFALVVGPEGLARLPLAVLVLALSYGGAAAWIAARSEGSIVRSSLALCIAVAIGCLALGEPRLLLVAIPAAIVAAGLGGFADAAFTAQRRHSWTLMLSVLAVLLAARGGLSFPAVRQPLQKQVSCVARLHRLQGEGFMRQQQWGSATASFNQALACNPDDVGALRQMGFLARDKNKNLRRALEYFEHAARVAPNSSQEWTNLSAIHLDLQQYAEALAAADKGLETSPRDTGLLHNRARALLGLGRAGDAATALRAYIDRAGRRPEEREAVREAELDLAGLGNTGASAR